MKAVCALVGLALLVGCSFFRHYTKVVNDPFRNEAERSLLSRACVQEFPAVQDTPRIIFSGVDSSDYLAVAEAYNALVDTLINREERGLPSRGAQEVPIELANQHNVYLDSLKIVRNTLRNYHPPAIIKTEIKQVKVTDVAAVSLKQSEVNACRYENEQLTKDAHDAKTKLGNRTTTMYWLLFVCLILLIGNVVQILSKVKS